MNRKEEEEEKKRLNLDFVKNKHPSLYNMVHVQRSKTYH